jgi:alpha-L-fucosidase
VEDAKHHNANWVMERLEFTRKQKMNYLLNIGPLGDGTVYLDDVRTLRQVGKRLRRDGWPSERTTTNVAVPE